jgi:hypothetical protein
MIGGKDMASLTEGAPVGQFITGTRVFGHQFPVDVSSNEMGSFLGAVGLVTIGAGKDIVGIRRILIGRS